MSTYKFDVSLNLVDNSASDIDDDARGWWIDLFCLDWHPNKSNEFVHAHTKGAAIRKAKRQLQKLIKELEDMEQPQLDYLSSDIPF